MMIGVVIGMVTGVIFGWVGMGLAWYKFGDLREWWRR